MLAHRLSRWPNIKTTFVECLMFGYPAVNKHNQEFSLGNNTGFRRSAWAIKCDNWMTDGYTSLPKYTQFE